MVGHSSEVSKKKKKKQKRKKKERKRGDATLLERVVFKLDEIRLDSSESPVYSSNARTRQEHPIYNTLSSGDGNGGGGNGVDVGVGVGAGVGAGAGWSYVSKDGFDFFPLCVSSFQKLLLSRHKNIKILIITTRNEQQQQPQQQQQQ
ncbi:hypothetical protein HZH66_003391 [Vespula vulgaris]|uniref:Uncharacterized protein n=1 Tax=Vespula vulgaris TaxID=7454 RepID=A0A836V0F7_VESVU|nr:hypothetical protein HZH66_003391 [Vespula vulgaris]